jgi:hypothetical protein
MNGIVLLATMGCGVVKWQRLLPDHGDNVRAKLERADRRQPCLCAADAIASDEEVGSASTSTAFVGHADDIQLIECDVGVNADELLRNASVAAAAEGHVHSPREVFRMMPSSSASVVY